MKSIKNTDRSRTNKELAKRENKVKCAKNDGVFSFSSVASEKFIKKTKKNLTNSKTAIYYMHNTAG